MAKCNDCGKKGFFLKVNTSGQCDDCERISRLGVEKNKLTLEIDKRNAELKKLEAA